MRTCIYPGSFDPITNGHLDIINRAVRIFDKLIVAVGNNENKKPLFTVEERVAFIRQAVNDSKNIAVESFSGLLVDFARKRDAIAIIKGLRALTDFEFEFQYALLNKDLDADIETVFMMTNIKYSYLSSSIVKEIAINNGSINELVPECIMEDILKKIRRNGG